MELVIRDDPAPLRLDEHDDVRVGGSRVLLDLVVHAFQGGASPEAIVRSYDTLSLSSVLPRGSKPL